MAATRAVAFRAPYRFPACLVSRRAASFCFACRKFGIKCTDSLIEGLPTDQHVILAGHPLARPRATPPWPSITMRCLARVALGHEFEDHLDAMCSH